MVKPCSRESRRTESDWDMKREESGHLRFGARFRSQVVVSTCLPEYLQ